MPSGHLRGYIENYFASSPTRQVKELLVSRAMLDFATAAVALFEPIYLYTIGFSLTEIFLIVGAVYVLYFLALPYGGKIASRHGYEHAILISSPFLILWYVSILAIPVHPAFVGVAIIALVLQKILYWPAYHAEFATWSSGADEGREISSSVALGGLAAVAAPALGGFAIAAFGFKIVFLIVAVLILLSNLPLLKTPERIAPKAFSYADAMRRFIAPARRTNIVTFAGFGEEFVALVAWPIFLAVVLPDARLIGTVVSAAMLANVLVTLYVGRIADAGGRLPMLKSGVIYVALSWIVRPFVYGGFGAFLVDAFYRTAKNMVNVPLLSAAYDAAREGEAMEEIVFFEMALAAGKASAAILAAAAFAFTDRPWVATFVIAAAYSTLYAAATRQRKS